MKEIPERLIFEYARDFANNNYVTAIEAETGHIPYSRKAEKVLGNYSERDIVKHFTHLASMNYSVDKGFYPLGSCTMKYNPRINEAIAKWPEFTGIHPYMPESFVQGTLRIIYDLNQALCELTGFSEFTLSPAAGAHGELTGMLIIRKYFDTIGENQRRKVLIPASAHGTNPASCRMAGFEPVTVHGNEEGILSPEIIEPHLDSELAALMITNPNTLGVYEKHLPEIADMLHKAGALVYMDGANFNAFVGRIKPADIGVDVMHLNLHKTFSTPHGGGGPGAGPVGVVEKLVDYLPVPYVALKRGKYTIEFSRKHTIGWIHSFLGNISVLIKAYAYLLEQGIAGLRRVSEMAVLNANYLMHLLKEHYDIPYQQGVMHEFVAQGQGFKEYGVTTFDVAKRLIDYGFHPPTVYFPLIVKDALMIEPTETESRETLEEFASALINIKSEMQENPELLHRAPTSTPVSRPDEKLAAREILSRAKG